MSEFHLNLFLQKDQKLDQQREKEIEEALERTCVPEGHDRFFQYADEVLELAKKKGRNTVPIEKVINVSIEYNFENITTAGHTHYKVYRRC